LVERLLCKQEVIGSIPFTSTSAPDWAARVESGGPRSGKSEFGWKFRSLRSDEIGRCLTLWICVNRGFLRGPWVLFGRMTGRAEPLGL
jgi:hypothetical protein